MTSLPGKSILLAVLLGSLLLLAAGCAPEKAVPEGASLEAGWQQYNFGAFDKALSTFGRVARRAPEKSDERLQALYGLATVWDLRRPGENPARAAELYEKVAALKPDSRFAAWSLLALARARALVPVGSQPDVPAVQAAYQRVIDAYPNEIAGEEAFILQQTNRLQTFGEADARAALAALESFTGAHPQSGYLPAAHGLMANAYRVLRDPEKRLAEEINALDAAERQARAAWERHPVGEYHSDSTVTGGQVFKVAHLAENEAGDFATARKYYQRFIQENPTEKRLFYARQALARMDQVEAEMRAQTPAPTQP